MFHLLAWTEDCVTATATDLNAVTDDIMQIQNNHFILPQDMFAMFQMGMATNITRLQLSSPTIRQVSDVDVWPLNLALVGQARAPFQPLWDYPFRLRGQEELVMTGTQTAGVNQRITALMAITPGQQISPSGDRYKIRATSVTAATANAWTTIALTFDNQLPVGQYAVVDAQHFSTNGQGFRLIFDNQILRPGKPSLPLVTTEPNSLWLGADLGEWGRFNTIGLPRCQVLCNAADNAHTLLLDVVRVG